MGDVEIEPHADRVGSDEVIDVAVLIECDLRIAGAWGQCAHHHRRPALLASQKLGDRVDVIDRETDDGAARWHAADLARAGPGQLREALTALEAHTGDQMGDRLADGVRAEKQCLGETAGVEQPVGEDMPAIRIAAELDLVDREKLGADIDRHRLDGADPVGGARRHDPLLAGDQRDHRGAAQRHDAVVDLAGQEPQGQADHAGPMPEHALDGVMGLAGIGGAQHRNHAAVAGRCHHGLRGSGRQVRGRQHPFRVRAG